MTSKFLSERFGFTWIGRFLMNTSVDDFFKDAIDYTPNFIYASIFVA